MNTRLPNFDKVRMITRANEALEKRRRERIYFAEAVGLDLIKIGFTTNLTVRISALRNQSPVPIKLIGSILGSELEEQRLHAEHDNLRDHGEWFRKCPPLMEQIKKLIELYKEFPPTN